MFSHLRSTCGFAVLVGLLLVTAPSVKAATLSVPAGAPQAEIQAIIDGAVAGDIVSFSPGTYYLTGPLTLKNGITIEGNNCTWIGDDYYNVVKVIDTARLSNVTIQNLLTQNVHFRFWPTNPANVSGITISNVEFSDGLAELGQTAIDSRFMIVKATNTTITGCRFLRTAGYPGKGIQLYLAQNTTITNNLFGTTSSTTPNPETYGYFKTAINTNNGATTGGFVSNTTISNNHIYRTAAMPDDAANSDHGIYTLGFDGMTIANNVINGWVALNSGGAVKMRQGRNGTIQNNTFVRSGILLYVYDNNLIQELRNVRVLNNTITVEGYDGVPHIYDGIGFWRNFVTYNVAEYSVRIEGNTIYNGAICIANANTHEYDFSAEGGGVFNNIIYNGGIDVLPGIAQSGNIVY